MSIVQAIGLSVLPNLGGIAGGFLTRSQIKNWYEVIRIRPEPSEYDQN